MHRMLKIQGRMHPRYGHLGSSAGLLVSKAIIMTAY